MSVERFRVEQETSPELVCGCPQAGDCDVQARAGAIRVCARRVLPID